MTPKQLRAIMTRCGWTQGDLMRLLPIKGTRSIRYWLSGHHEIRPVIAARIRQLASQHEGKEGA